MAFDANYEAQRAAASAMVTLKDMFPQVDEMDKMLGLASDDKLKTTLENILPKFAEKFGAAIYGKGANTETPASVNRIMALFCYYMGLNIVESYKDADEARLTDLFEHVSPFAIKIVEEMEKKPVPLAQIENMLKQCVDRFCKEFGEK